jgi:hypothetical protein
MNSYLNGAITVASLVLLFFFLRFWRQTHERLFGIFAWAFGMLAVERVVLEMTDPTMESRPFVYLFRLAAFLLIIAGVVDKNRKQQAADSEQSGSDEQERERERERRLRAVR